MTPTTLTPHEKFPLAGFKGKKTILEGTVTDIYTKLTKKQNYFVQLTVRDRNGIDIIARTFRPHINDLVKIGQYVYIEGIVEEHQDQLYVKFGRLEIQDPNDWINETESESIPESIPTADLDKVSDLIQVLRLIADGIGYMQDSLTGIHDELAQISGDIQQHLGR